MFVTSEKNCFCHTCGRAFHYLGINRHVAMHRDRQEQCTVTYTYGDKHTYHFERSRLVRNPAEEAKP